jgi:hypothetical protein
MHESCSLDEPVPSSIALPNESIISRSFRDAGRHDVIKWDVFPVRDGEHVGLFFESAHADGRHGAWLMTDLGLKVHGVSARSVSLWSDTVPPVVDITIRTGDGRLHVYNIWDSGAGMNSQAWTSGMLIEELPNGRRYRCNDIGLHGAFDSVVFRLERLGTERLAQQPRSP